MHHLNPFTELLSVCHPNRLLHRHPGKNVEGVLEPPCADKCCWVSSRDSLSFSTTSQIWRIFHSIWIVGETAEIESEILIKRNGRQRAKKKCTRERREAKRCLNRIWFRRKDCKSRKPYLEYYCQTRPDKSGRGTWRTCARSRVESARAQFAAPKWQPWTKSWESFSARWASVCAHPILELSRRGTSTIRYTFCLSVVLPSLVWTYERLPMKKGQCVRTDLAKARLFPYPPPLPLQRPKKEEPPSSPTHPVIISDVRI